MHEFEDVLMLGVEVFRPLRELRVVLHQGMLGLSAAQSILALLALKPQVSDIGPTGKSDAVGGLGGGATPLPPDQNIRFTANPPIQPAITFEGVTFSYPGAATPARRAYSRLRATRVGSISTPIAARAPKSRTAAITRRPSPDPRS